MTTRLAPISTAITFLPLSGMCIVYCVYCVCTHVVDMGLINETVCIFATLRCVCIECCVLCVYCVLYIYTRSWDGLNKPNSMYLFHSQMCVLCIMCIYTRSWDGFNKPNSMYLWYLGMCVLCVLCMYTRSWHGLIKTKLYVSFPLSDVCIVYWVLCVYAHVVDMDLKKHFLGSTD